MASGTLYTEIHRLNVSLQKKKLCRWKKNHFSMNRNIRAISNNRICTSLRRLFFHSFILFLFERKTIFLWRNNHFSLNRNIRAISTNKLYAFIYFVFFFILWFHFFLTCMILWGVKHFSIKWINFPIDWSNRPLLYDWHQ